MAAAGAVWSGVERAMTDAQGGVDRVLWALQERAKELACLYRIDEIVNAHGTSIEDVSRAALAAIPPGWQYPDCCQVRIALRGLTVQPPDFLETPWVQTAAIMVRGEAVGSLSVSYTREMPPADEGPFLKEERKLIQTIANRLGHAVALREAAPGAAVPPEKRKPEFWVILDLLRRTDRNLHNRMARKMLNHLSWSGAPEARALLGRLSPGPAGADEDENRPLGAAPPEDTEPLAEQIFLIAGEHVGEQEIVSLIQTWIREDRVDFLVKALETPYTSLVEIGNALDRYQRTGVRAAELSLATQLGLKTALVRRLLTDHLDFINTARRFIEVEDFVELMTHTIHLPRSHGRLGGKASGLFLAQQVLRRSPEFGGALSGIRIPRTWYLPSDGILQFVAYNDFDEVYAWKYRDIDQLRQEYPHILQLFKNSRFPPEIVHGLSRALDDLGERPLIVRSSSLLEDRVGSAFSGKYKSLFLANRGDKPVRLAALLDAVAEVYASTFGPDPIQYRSERGLLDDHEEMATMIQEVVGVRAGRYFLPAFSGVAFSNNDLRWSPRIRREDGLLRMVPGLGTRAVDRLADDYPVLIAPGQPNLRVNASLDEVVRYSPKKVDVIDLERCEFVTLELHRLLEEAGAEYPALAQLVSVVDGDRIRRPGGLGLATKVEDLVFTFEGLASETPFVAQMRTLLRLLRETLGTPVDLEFASDGRDLYLLQCRPQGSPPQDAPALIPRDIPPSQVLFTANRYVSNGTVSALTHVVYVDPEGYASLHDLGSLKDVGRAVGQLNKLLPKRQFVLMGPGRWGSRGDLKLGVSVTYADINNTAAIIEIARKKGNYVPDLSFGTHFFQDLVESAIRYLPLYPDDADVVFNEPFFSHSPNLLPRLLPEMARLADVVRVIDVPGTTGGQVLQILMNADLDEAAGVLVAPAGRAQER
jgi:hypothetical protein